MKRLTLILIALATYTLLASNHCKKDPAANAKLPPATQEGRNTVGFMIDDEVWIPYYECRFMGDPCGEILARYGYSGGAAPNGIDFGFTRENEHSNKSSHLTISSSDGGTITSSGNKIDSIVVIYRGELSSGNTDVYSGPLTDGNSKFIITKFDEQSQIISGEFEFILREDNGSGKTITLKDGRFDFSFNACKCSN